MRKLFTMFLVLVAVVAFAQTNVTSHFINHPIGNPKPVYYNTYTKHLLFSPHERSSLSRAVSTCDSFDLLDYGSYAEVIGLRQGLPNAAFYGLNNGQLNNGNPIYIQEMSSQVTAYSASNNDLSYVGEAFDTLAFQDYPSNAIYSYPLASSTITLEGLNFFYAFGANESDGDSAVLNDSLIFQIYAINNAAGVGTIAASPDTTVVIAGDSLVQFVNGDSIGLGSVAVGYTFQQGQGFFVKAIYVNKDTSTHFSMCMTFIDSCGPITITFNGTQYPGQIFAGLSPLTSDVEYTAAPLFGTSSPNAGLAFFGSIIDDAAGGEPLGSYNQNNTFGYGGITGLTPVLPLACQFATNQNWAILPIIDVCQGYSAQIQASSQGACPNSNVSLTGTVTGSAATLTGVQPDEAIQSGGSFYIDSLHIGNGTNPNLTYTWTATSGTNSISDPTSSNPTITMPAQGNDTVNVTINDGIANATASIVINSSPITLHITNPQPIQLTCGGAVTISTSVTGTVTGHDYTWKGVNLDTTGTGVSKLKVSYPGTYYISVTNAAGCSSADTVIVENPGVSNTASFTVSSPVCENKLATFTNTSTNQSGWNATYYFGNNAQTPDSSAGILSPTFTYTNNGGFNVELVMDSANCVFQSPAVHVIVYPASSTTCTAAIEDISFDNSISLMPNPTNGYVNMVINGVQGNVSIRVYNILGSEVTSYSATDLPSSFNKSFDFGNLASGTYLVKIQSGEHIAVKRLVISK